MRLFILITIISICSTVMWGQNVAINATGAAPNSSAMLDVSSTNSGMLIPRMTSVQRTSIASPATGLIVYQTDLATGFYYFDGSVWSRLSAAPANTEWWIRPVAPGTYIEPIANSYIRVYDSGQTYGVFYDGNANQYAIYAKTSSAMSPTSAIVGFSDVAGNQTYGYLGYNGTYTAPTAGFGSVDGAAVYGVVDDPNRASVFGRTTGSASMASIIGYSDVWIPGYFYGDHIDAAYAARPAVYGQMAVSIDNANYQPAIKGFGEYTGSNNTGYTVGGEFIASGGSQDSYGVMGLPATTGSAIGVGVYGEDGGNVAGTDYFSNNISAIEGNGAWGNYQYNFGVTGRVAGAGTTTRQGGVLGTWWTSDWGALGYLNSGGTAYGLIFVGGYTTTAKNTNTTATSIGMGGYGDLMGGWIRGNVYGLHLKANRYSLYVDGKQYTNDIIAQLNTTDNNEERIVTYVPTSLSVDVYAKGIITLEDGTAKVTFDPDFTEMVSDNEPVVVTVTPMGKSQGVYLEYVNKNGFKVVEIGYDSYQSLNNSSPEKTKSLTVSYIAIGTRKGYENPDVPDELLSKDYDNNMDGVMHNESDTDTNATSIWWDGNSLRFDTPPPLIKPVIKRKIKPILTKEATSNSIK